MNEAMDHVATAPGLPAEQARALDLNPLAPAAQTYSDVGSYTLRNSSDWLGSAPHPSRTPAVAPHPCKKAIHPGACQGWDFDRGGVVLAQVAIIPLRLSRRPSAIPRR